MALGQLHEYLNLFVAGEDGVVLISTGFQIYARRSAPRRIPAVPHLCVMELCYTKSTLIVSHQRGTQKFA